MADEMAVGRIDMVIDGDGVAKTIDAMRTIDKYMERLQKRAEQLGRTRVRIQVGLSDCLCDPIRKIRAKLDMLTSTKWNVALQAKFQLDSKALENLKATVELAANFGDLTGKPTDNQQPTDSTASKGAVDWSLDALLGGGLGVFLFNLLKDGIKDIAKVPIDVLKDTLKDALKGKLQGLFGKSDKGEGASPAADPAQSAARTMEECCCKCCDDAGGSMDIGRRERGKGVDGRGKGMGGDATGRGRSGGSSGGKAGGVRGLLNRAANVGKTVWDAAKKRVNPSTGTKALKGAAAVGGTALVVNSAMKVAGKAFRPLGLVSDAASIANAKPGEERNKAIGRAAGGTAGAIAGAALGSLILPGAGTVVGGMLGGLAGEWIGGAVSKLFGKKKKPDPVPPAPVQPSAPPPPPKPPMPKPPAPLPTPTMAAPLALAPLPMIGPPAPPAQAPAPTPVNINIGAGAVQLNVQERNLNYDQITAMISARLSASIRLAMENRP